MCRLGRHNHRLSRKASRVSDGLVAARGDVSWSGACQGLFFDGEVGMVVDVGGADALMPFSGVRTARRRR